MAFSNVLEHAAATPEVAERHFAGKLSLETDPSDVYADLCSGTGDFLILDVRSRKAYEAAHVPTALSLPHRQIDEDSTASFDKGRLIVVYCWGPACNAAAKGGLRLARLGFQVKEMIGGFEYWAREGMPIEGTTIELPDLVGKISAS